MRLFRILPLLAAAIMAAILVMPSCDTLVTESNTITLIDTTLGLECSRCHTDGNNRYLRPLEQWRNSAHASDELFNQVIDLNGTAFEVAECGPQCHTHEGYLAWLANGSKNRQNRPNAIGCFTCHSPHTGDFGSWSDTILRDSIHGSSGEIYLVGTVFYDKGKSNLCAQCHKARFGITPPTAGTVTLTAEFGPHNSCQADGFMGSAGHLFGAGEVTNPHANITDGCLGCHFGTGAGYEFGEHTFRLRDDQGNQYLDNCQSSACHSGSDVIDSLHHFSRYGSIPTYADSLEFLLKAWGYLDASDPDGLRLNAGQVVSDTVATIIYNYLFFRLDGSGGVHNPAFFERLLSSSVKQWDEAAPVANFGMSDSVVCIGEEIFFYDSSISVIDIEARTWTLGPEYTTYELNPSFSFVIAGVFNITLEVSDNYGTSSITKQVTVTGPVAAFETDTTEQFAGITRWFYDRSECIVEPSTKWKWTFGDSIIELTTTDITDSISFEFWDIGQAEITLKVTNDLDTIGSSYSQSIQSKGPEVAFNANRLWGRPDSVGMEVVFSNESEFSFPLNYIWHFGDTTSADSISTLENPTHTYNIPGGYDVTLTGYYIHNVTDTLTNTMQMNDFIRVWGPAALFTVGETSDCAPFTVWFYNKSLGEYNIDSLRWHFGDSSADSMVTISDLSIDSISHTYDTAGTISCSLQVFSEYGSLIDTSVAVKQNLITVLGPSAEITKDAESVCFGSPITFEAIPGCEVTNWLWDFGDSTSSTDQNPSHSWDSVGTFTVTLTMSSSYGVTTENTSVTVDGPGIIAGVETVSGCTPFSPVFTTITTCEIDSTVWTFGDGAIQTFLTDETIEHEYESLGEYTVSVEAYGPGGMAADTIVDKVIATGPEAKFTMDKDTVCVGTDIQFTVTSGCDITSWEWQFGDGGTSTEESPSHSYSEAGQYYINLIVSDNLGNADTATSADTVTIMSGPPTASFAIFAEYGWQGQSGYNIQFVNRSTNFTQAFWEWDHGIDTTHTGPPPDTLQTHYFPIAGIYTVKLTTINPCDTTATTLEVEIPEE